MYSYTYIHTRIHTCTHAHTHTYTHTHTHIRTHTHTHTHTHTYTHAHTHTACLHDYVHAYKYIGLFQKRKVYTNNNTSMIHQDHSDVMNVPKKDLLIKHIQEKLDRFFSFFLIP